MRIIALGAVLAFLLAGWALSDAAYAEVQTAPTEGGTIDVRLTYDDDIQPNETTKLNVDFLNPTTGNIQVHIDYTITITKDGDQVFGPTSLIHTSPGTITVPIQFQGEGAYSVGFTVEGILFQPIPSEGVSFVIPVGDAPPAPQDAEAVIPSWIKTSAGWWADGQIDDATFVTALEYLIQNGILVVPSADDGNGDGSGNGTPGGDAAIPSWIKTSAGWWADGQIDDATFVASIQYLIAQKIIQVA